MNTDARLAALERKLQYLTDRQQILDCIVSTSRGNDRFDVERISGAYHSDGLHELGQRRISGADYGAHANHAHAAISETNLHNVTMHSCEIDGDVAHAESYVIGLSSTRVAKQRGSLRGDISIGLRNVTGSGG